MRRRIAKRATNRKPARRATTRRTSTMRRATTRRRTTTTRRATTTRRTSTTRRATTGKIWTPTEISSLRQSYRSMPTRTIARQLKRTMSSVQTKARSLGLKKAANGSWMASPMKKKTTKKSTGKGKKK